MTTITLWLLIATAGGSHTSPVVIARFSDKAQCEAVVARMESQSSFKSGMRNLYGVCVQADKVVL